MSQYKEVEVGSIAYFWFAANDTTGTAADGATPLYDVRLAGAAAGAAPTASGTPTLLSHADYAAGIHEIAIDTTGYAAGEYAVFCTLTVSTVNPSGFCGSFKCVAAGESVASRVAAMLTTALTESYATDGSTATVAQLLYMLLSILGQATISGTTLTTYKLDGTTPAMTFTLNDADQPSSRTRSS